MSAISRAGGRPLRDTAPAAAMTALAHPIGTGLWLAAAAVLVAGLAGALPVPPVLPVALLVTAVSAGLPGPLPGLPVPTREQPDLHELVTRVAAATGVDGPIRVRVAPTALALLARRRVGRRRGHVLVLGWPLLTRLTRSQLAAVVAHEFAHTRHLADHGLTWLSDARAELAARPGLLARGPAVALLAATRERVWATEYAADAVAAEVAGGPAILSALRRVRLESAVLDLVLAGWRPSEAFSPYRAAAAAVSDPRARQEALAAIERDEAIEAWAAHPPTPLRLAAVDPATPALVVLAGGPVDLADPTGLERRCLRELARTTRLLRWYRHISG